MDENRRKFIAGIAAIAGAAALDGFGLLKSYSAVRPASITTLSKPSRNINDYPHIIDVIPSRDMKRYFHIIVDACFDPDHEYISKIPFIIELEVAKIWAESRFEWDALSNAGAAGLQQLMPGTARDFGLMVKQSSELRSLDSAISEYRGFRDVISDKRQELHEIVETGRAELTRAELIKVNKLRAELDDLYTRRAKVYNRLKLVKSEYVHKIQVMTENERKRFDARFVPELLIPVGVEHLFRDITECRDYFGGTIEMNIWRGIAAYNSGLERTKKWNGLPFIQETVHYTRNVISDLTRSLELKHAYSTGDKALIADIKKRIGLRKRQEYSIYVVKEGDCFDEILREQIMDKYKVSYTKAIACITDDRGNKLDPRKMSIIFPNQTFRIYPPK
jgi:hypothetical protein